MLLMNYPLTCEGDGEVVLPEGESRNCKVDAVIRQMDAIVLRFGGDGSGRDGSPLAAARFS
jgi:hypothetical protein